MKIDDVNRGVHKFKKRKRLGRGPGSGQGKTAGRGHKGAGSRAGWSNPAVFQGGTMPLVRRVPKRGFTNPWAVDVAAVNLRDLEAVFETGDEVTPESIKAKGVRSGRYDELKILGEGELTKALTVSAHRFSKSAVEKIEKAGGKVVTLPAKVLVETKKAAAKAAKKESAKAKQS
jgi:large subunit ribosomal protein L15